MGRVCGTYGGQDKCIRSFGGETREGDDLADIGVDGLILNWIFKKEGRHGLLDYSGSE